MRRFEPYGRVPVGEPGFKFSVGRKGPRAPLQAGYSVPAEEQGDIECYREPPEWMAGGDYWVFTVLDEKDGTPYTVDHVCLGVREGSLMAWYVQADEPYQGKGAERMLPKGFAWKTLDAGQCIMDLSRRLYKIQPTFPDMQWTLTARIEGRDPIVLGTDAEMLDVIEGKLGAN